MEGSAEDKPKPKRSGKESEMRRMNGRVNGRKSNMKIFVGVDIGKRKHDACFLREDGDNLGYVSFANSGKGFNKFMGFIERFIKEGYSVSVTVEATGHYFLNLYSFLRNRSVEVIVVNPIQTDSFRNVFIRKSKYDKRDAFIIAELARVGRARSSVIRNDKTVISELRMLTRFRANYIKRKTNITKKLSALVDRVFPEFFKVFKGLSSNTALMILRTYPTPRKILKEDRKILFDSVKKWSRGRIKEEKVMKLVELAKQSIGSPIDIDAIEIEIPFIVNEIFFIKEQVRKIEKEIEQKSEGVEEIKIIRTIPGIGSVSAASIAGEIANIDRFGSVKKLRAFAGIDPSVKESGSSVRGRSTLSKRGSPYLRRALYYAANAARRFSPVFKEYYERKISQHPENKGRYAIVATANKLLTVIYYMLKHKEPFNPEYQWKGSRNSVKESIDINVKVDSEERKENGRKRRSKIDTFDANTGIVIFGSNTKSISTSGSKTTKKGGRTKNGHVIHQ